MNATALKECLKGEGATLVGVGDITEALPRDITHLNRGIALAVNRSLNQDSIKFLLRLQRLTKKWLKERGFRSLSIPPLFLDFSILLGASQLLVVERESGNLRRID